MCIFEVNQDYSEQNEVDGMKKGADALSAYCKPHQTDPRETLNLELNK